MEHLWVEVLADRHELVVNVSHGGVKIFHHIAIFHVEDVDRFVDSLAGLVGEVGEDRVCEDFVLVNLVSDVVLEGD